MTDPQRRIRVSRIVDAPVSQVFAFLADPTNQCHSTPAVDERQLRASLDKLADVLGP
jgi:hypothetical protein